jgi:hydroxymethylbilane synthase
MRIRIAARASDLARIQAHAVADAIRAARAGVEIEFEFRKSLGDVNQHDPLWKMPEKGVFTEDFRGDLLSCACDLVVHSWKDLPIDTREGTEIVATLPRADPRDLLLFKRSSVGKRAVRILSSSPRRAYNLAPFLASHLPGAPSPEFVAVRGNVPTRVRIWKEGEEDGLIVAKAALDRILSTTADEFAEARDSIRSAIRGEHWAALPISANPPAAAQGALAIEIRSDRADLRELLARVNHPDTFRAATLEREILKGYGGGCHQKIGVAILPRAYGMVESLRGTTDRGEILDRLTIRGREFPLAGDASKIWPAEGEKPSFFERVALPTSNPGQDLWVSRADALPADWKIGPFQVVWTSGLETWRKLAERGIWVHGSAESLGEGEPSGIETLLRSLQDRAPIFTKLTHSEGLERDLPTLPTYSLRPRPGAFEAAREEWKGVTHFFWMSGSLFQYCLERAPEIRDAFHACGPGNTHEILRRILGPDRPIGVFLGIDEWRREVKR